MPPGTDSASADPRSTTVLLVGLSTRAIAESAARAGYTTLAVDGFGDLDHPAHPLIALGRDLGTPYSALAAARASRRLACDTVAYTSSLENHPRAVALLSRGRRLLGNPPAVLERARDPVHLAHTLRSHGYPAPAIRALAPQPSAAGEPRWLEKPRASGGGHGIRQWTPGRTLARTRILQEQIDGIPGSISFVGDGEHAVPFALTRQLVGDPAFGAQGFAYCGSILAAPPSPHLLHTATEIAHTLARELRLVGANGLDFIVRAGTPWVIEVNPRYSASMELAERLFGFSVFDAHLQAAQGALPAFDLAASLRGAGAVGKAVLFARRTLTVGDTRAWLERDDLRDIPHPGERIPRGRPVCTIFAHGRDDPDCYARLVRRAQELYAEIEGRRWRIA
jgi:predicted ATP-grasp superfamily ATP-dependent carboligase